MPGKETTSPGGGEKGRLTLLWIVLVGVAALCMAIGIYGYQDTLALWGIPVKAPSFADARVITSGAEAYALGYDPLRHNPTDYWRRQTNYPRIWAWSFAAFGLDQGDTDWIGVLFILLFLAGISMFVGKVSHRTAVVIAVMIFSPAVLLALERGNNDLFIFFLLSLVLVSARHSTALSAGLLLSAGVLKLYPIFGLTYLFRERRQKCLIFAACVSVLFIAYAAATYSSLRLVRETTPRSMDISYGMNVAWMRIERVTGSADFGRVVRYASRMLLAGIVLLSFLRRTGETCGDNSNHMDAFRVGASIYAGTFFLGNNWTYRLVFLIFVAPQLMVWAHGQGRWRSAAAKITLFALLVTCWSMLWSSWVYPLPFGPHLAFVLDESLKWMLFAGLTYLLIDSRPDWLTKWSLPRPPWLRST